VVDVVQASTSDGAWLDGSHEPAGHQSGHELATVLAAYRAGELAVLPFQKTSGMDHDAHLEGVLAAFAQFDNDVRSDRTRADETAEPAMS